MSDKADLVSNPFSSLSFLSFPFPPFFPLFTGFFLYLHFSPCYTTSLSYLPYIALP